MLKVFANWTKFFFHLGNVSVLSREKCDPATVTNFVNSCLACGSIAIKFGQLLVALRVIPPGEQTETLFMVANTSHPYEYTEKVVQEFIKDFPEHAQLFESMQRVPIATGGCAQLYLADDCAVKIVHPGIREEIMRLRGFIKKASKLWPRPLSSVSLFLMYLNDLEQQFDMKLEEENCRRFMAILPILNKPFNKNGARVPTPYASTQDCLLMERVPAPSAPQVAKMVDEATAQALTLKTMSFIMCLYHSFFTGKVPIFHGDCHAHNIGILSRDFKDCQFIIFDFGILLEGSHGRGESSLQDEQDYLNGVSMIDVTLRETKGSDRFDDFWREVALARAKHSEEKRGWVPITDVCNDAMDNAIRNNSIFLDEQCELNKTTYRKLVSLVLMATNDPDSLMPYYEYFNCDFSTETIRRLNVMARCLQICLGARLLGITKSEIFHSWTVVLEDLKHDPMLVEMTNDLYPQLRQMAALCPSES